MINDGNPYAPLTVNTSDNNEPKKEALPDGVNTIKEVLDWVGGDQDRAILVLEAEESEEKPRVTLVEKLEEIING